MRKSIALVFLIAVAVFSCNRPESKRENLQKSITEFSKQHADLNIVTAYYPKTYTEVKTDSIIANAFKVSIRNYSKMDAQILVGSETIATKTKLNYHRVFESEIHVALASKTIFNTTINAEGFKNSLEPDFWNNATLEHVWVNQEASNGQEIYISLSFINPKNKTYKLYELMIDRLGKQHLKLTEEYS